MLPKTSRHPAAGLTGCRVGVPLPALEKLAPHRKLDDIHAAALHLVNIESARQGFVSRWNIFCGHDSSGVFLFLFPVSQVKWRIVQMRSNTWISNLWALLAAVGLLIAPLGLNPSLALAQEAQRETFNDDYDADDADYDIDDDEGLYDEEYEEAEYRGYDDYLYDDEGYGYDYSDSGYNYDDEKWWENSAYYNEDEWYDPTDWFDGNNYEYAYDDYDGYWGNYDYDYYDDGVYGDDYAYGDYYESDWGLWE
jgi:hypothetical protein